MTERTKDILIGIVAVTVTIIIGALILRPMIARAEADPYQTWIHNNRADCCDHRDCTAATVTMTFTGWQVRGAYNVVPFAQVIRWPFGVPYACVTRGRVRCLLMNAGG